MAIRKSFRNLSTTEKENFLEAVLTLKNTVANPNAPVTDQISIYDQFVALHGAVMGLAMPGGGVVNFGHNNDLFLPWHRQYLLDFENALQIVHPDVAIPYWDWTQRQATRSTLFQDDFMGRIGERQLHLASGYFAQNAPNPAPDWWPVGFDGWHIREEFQPINWRALPSTMVRSLIRAGDSSSNLPTGTQINAVINQLDDYQSFRMVIEGGTMSIRTHNSGHNWIGGHMGTGFSPVDPIFFMHHANVDRLWAQWQSVDSFRASDLPINLTSGVGRNDPMWPWVGDAPGYQIMNTEIVDLVRDYSNDPLVTADDVLDWQALGYVYE